MCCDSEIGPGSVVLGIDFNTVYVCPVNVNELVSFVNKPVRVLKWRDVKE